MKSEICQKKNVAINSSQYYIKGYKEMLCVPNICVFKVGEIHEKTKESSEYLKYLTQQAVALQRTMNEIYKNGSNASIMPLKVSHNFTHLKKCSCIIFLS